MKNKAVIIVKHRILKNTNNAICLPAAVTSSWIVISWGTSSCVSTSCSSSAAAYKSFAGGILSQIETKVRINGKKDYSCMYHYHSLHEFYICVSSKSRTIDPNWSFIKNDNCLYISFPQSSWVLLLISKLYYLQLKYPFPNSMWCLNLYYNIRERLFINNNNTLSKSCIIGIFTTSSIFILQFL